MKIRRSSKYDDFSEEQLIRSMMPDRFHVLVDRIYNTYTVYTGNFVQINPLRKKHIEIKNGSFSHHIRVYSEIGFRLAKDITPLLSKRLGYDFEIILEEPVWHLSIDGE